MGESEILGRLVRQSARNHVYDLATLERRCAGLSALDLLFDKGHLGRIERGLPTTLVAPTVLGFGEINHDLIEDVGVLCSLLRRRYSNHGSELVIVDELAERTRRWLRDQWHPSFRESLPCALWAIAAFRSAQLIIPRVEGRDEGSGSYAMIDFTLHREILRFPTELDQIIELEKKALQRDALADASPVRHIVPDLAYMHDDKLREIVERDYNEAQVCYESAAWKAVIILCGSALEALLLGNHPMHTGADLRQ